MAEGAGHAPSTIFLFVSKQRGPSTHGTGHNSHLREHFQGLLFAWLGYPIMDNWISYDLCMFMYTHGMMAGMVG